MPQILIFFLKFAAAVESIVGCVGVGSAQVGPAPVDGLAVAHAAAGAVG